LNTARKLQILDGVEPGLLGLMFRDDFETDQVDCETVKLVKENYVA
jgi:hypothetical protein